MKMRAVVTDTADPEAWGRIQARLIGFDDAGNVTPWCWPCTPLAGPGYGFYCLPEVDDEVWVERAYDGSWVWTGFYWSGRHAKPESGAAHVRVWRSPTGQEIAIDDAGDIKITHNSGSTLTLKQNGDIEVTAAKNILLNDSGSCRVVNTQAICHYTGTPHPQGSRTVFSEKP